MVEGALDTLQKQINEEEEKLGKYCRRCSYEGKRVLMHTATVQWTDNNHIKHSTPILRVCPECRDIRWLPNQFSRAKHQGGYIHDPQIVEKDGKKYYSGGFSKLEMADLMKELAIIRERLHLIKLAFIQNDPMLTGNTAGPFDWKQFIKAFFEKI